MFYTSLPATNQRLLLVYGDESSQVVNSDLSISLHYIHFVLEVKKMKVNSLFRFPGEQYPCTTNIDKWTNLRLRLWVANIILSVQCNLFLPSHDEIWLEITFFLNRLYCLKLAQWLLLCNHATFVVIILDTMPLTRIGRDLRKIIHNWRT